MRSMMLGGLVAPLSACGGDDGGGGVPAAPTNLMGSVLSGGAHLTWTDNSDDETQFMVMRKEMGGGDFTTVASPTFNTTQYHDAPLTSGKTYIYMVMTMNDAGESAASNEVMVAIP
jgi:fibronectin type 3 domain-containing protein